LIEELVADSEREDQFQIVLVEDKVRAEGEDGAERSAAWRSDSSVRGGVFVRDASLTGGSLFRSVPRSLRASTSLPRWC